MQSETQEDFPQQPFPHLRNASFVSVYFVFQISLSSALQKPPKILKIMKDVIVIIHVLYDYINR